MTAPTGRAPRYKNKGQRRRAIPADELAGKYAAAQRDTGIDTGRRGRDLRGGKEKEKKTQRLGSAVGDL